MSMSDEMQEPFFYGTLGENPNAPGFDIHPERLRYEPKPDPMIAILTRIADALDRAYPIPEERKSGKLKPGVAEYKYEDPQTEELRLLRDGPKETPSH